MCAGDDRSNNVRAALEHLGDVPLQGVERVLVKPNFVSLHRPLSATHPDAVDALLAWLRDRFTGEVQLIEGGAGHPRLAGFQAYGYVELAKRYGASLEEIGEGRPRALAVYDRRMRAQQVFADERMVDSVFTVSITPPKMHDTVIYTASLKNLIMGSLLAGNVCVARQVRRRLRQAACVAWDSTWPLFIASLPDRLKNTRFFCNLDFALIQMFRETDSRLAMHQSFAVMHLNLCLLARCLRPHLSVLDAFEVMEGNGPIDGNPARMRTALASTDCLAADACGARLMGVDPGEVGYLRHCARLGLGRIAAEEIELVGTEALPVPERSLRRHCTYDQQLRWRDPRVEAILAGVGDGQGT